jgi:hypothetical protein
MPFAEPYDFVREDGWNARNPLSGTRLPMRQWQFGGSIGGPVVRDRTFYFGNVEHRALDQTGLTTIAGAICRQSMPGWRPSATRATRGNRAYPNPIDTTNVLVKIDQHVNSRSQIGGRFALYRVAARNVRGVGGLSAPTALPISTTWIGLGL